MTLIRRSAVAAAVLLPVASGIAGCREASEELRRLPTFGPESLQVAFVRAPDTLGFAGAFTVTVAAYNRARGVVTMLSPCAEQGFRVRVVSSGYVRDLDAGPCGGAVVGPATLAPNDSLIATLTGADLGLGASPRSQLEASYVDTAGRSPVVARPLVVRNAVTCPPTDPSIHYAVSVAVRDAATGAWLPATVVATDGSFQEVLSPGPGMPGVAAPPSYYGVAERTGTYQVSVNTPGYRLWTRQNVAVTRGADCHVQTASVVALLDPSS